MSKWAAMDGCGGAGRSAAGSDIPGVPIGSGLEHGSVAEIAGRSEVE
jgi:hypothetical protein